MLRRSRLSILAAILVVSGIGLWSYLHGAREPAAERAPVYSAPKSVAAQPSPSANPVASSGNTAATGSAGDIDKLIDDATGDDPGVKGAAITALGNAPKERVLPVLQSLTNGGDVADRRRALQSLRTIAIQQGDQDGLVRDLVRQVIYHSEDDVVVHSAQSTLEEIETALASMPHAAPAP